MAYGTRNRTWLESLPLAVTPRRLRQVFKFPNLSLSETNTTACYESCPLENKWTRLLTSKVASVRQDGANLRLARGSECVFRYLDPELLYRG